MTSCGRCYNIFTLFLICFCCCYVNGQVATTAKSITEKVHDYDDVQYLVPSSSSSSIDNTEREIVLWQELKKEIQTLKKSHDNESKLLARLQAENQKLKISLRKLEQQQQQRSNVSAVVLKTTKSNDQILLKMSKDLEKLKGNLNYWIITPTSNVTSRKRRDDDDGKLYTEVEGLKQEITAIKLLEDEQLPTMMTNLSEHGKTLDHLLTVTEDLETKLATLESTGVGKIVAKPITNDEFRLEMNKMDVRVSQVGVFANKLQDKLFELNDKYTWYTFLVEHFNTELHIVKNELYKMMKLFYKVDKPTLTLPESDATQGQTENRHYAFFGEEEQSGDEPLVFIPETQKETHNIRVELDQLHMKTNDAHSGVHQLLTRMNSLELQQTALERRMNKLKDDRVDSAVVDQCAAQVGRVKTELANFTGQLEIVKSKLVGINNIVTDEVHGLRKEINQCTLKCDRAHSLAQVVKDHQVDHFSAIQELKQSLNELDTSVNIITAKLATLQSDFLNATLTTYKDVNKELKQDLRLTKLESDFDRMEKKFAETQDSIKSVFSTLKQKADRTDFKRISDDVEKNNEKLQLVATVRESLNALSENVEKLESQLPQDCSMRTVPSKSGAYQTGTYLVKPDRLSESIDVKCDMETDGGYWTVIQQRTDGKESFNRSWASYADGFGDPTSDYWFGNKFLSILTNKDNYQLKIDVWDIFDDHFYALYDTFRVRPVNEFYALEIGGFSGNLTDSMAYHNGMKFSSVDKDLDVSSTNCAKYYESGWWFSHCQMANLNGNFDIGMIWFSNQTQDWIQLKRTVMKIRPKSLFL